jgi:hypothetical protein
MLKNDNDDDEILEAGSADINDFCDIIGIFIFLLMLILILYSYKYDFVYIFFLFCFIQEVHEQLNYLFQLFRAWLNLLTGNNDILHLFRSLQLLTIVKIVLA